MGSRLVWLGTDGPGRGGERTRGGVPSLISPSSRSDGAGVVLRDCRVASACARDFFMRLLSAAARRALTSFGGPLDVVRDRGGEEGADDEDGWERTGGDGATTGSGRVRGSALIFDATDPIEALREGGMMVLDE